MTQPQKKYTPITELPHPEKTVKWRRIQRRELEKDIVAACESVTLKMQMLQNDVVEEKIRVLDESLDRINDLIGRYETQFGYYMADGLPEIGEPDENGRVVTGSRRRGELKFRTATVEKYMKIQNLRVDLLNKLMEGPNKGTTFIGKVQQTNVGPVTPDAVKDAFKDIVDVEVVGE